MLMGAVAVTILGVVFVQLFVKVYTPYMAHLATANRLYRESYDYATDQGGLCIDTEENLRLRQKVKHHYDKCDDAKAILESWPFWMAFGKLMDDYDLCPKGCFQVKFDMLSSLGALFVAIVGSLALLLVLLVGGIILYFYRSLQSSFDLPFGTSAIDRAANMAKGKHQHCGTTSMGATFKDEHCDTTSTGATFKDDD
jgi:hypothetical protein